MLTPTPNTSRPHTVRAMSFLDLIKNILGLFVVAQLAFGSNPVLAKSSLSSTNQYRTVVTESWTEEWDENQCHWVKVGDSQISTRVEALPKIAGAIANGAPALDAPDALTATPKPSGAALGRYGPFLVATATKALMVGATNVRSPQDFDAMMRDHPGISILNMVEAPGTTHDIANLAVGRKIRAAGISTHVPRNGSVRSGAVELFLAGQTRSIDDGAVFAVHSWRDYNGREPDDFARDHPVNRFYLDYYVEMGMSEQRASDFYDMTNSVPHTSALWLQADDMRNWLPAASRKIASQCRTRMLSTKANRAWHRHFPRNHQNQVTNLKASNHTQFLTQSGGHSGGHSKAKILNVGSAAPSP